MMTHRSCCWLTILMSRVLNIITKTYIKLEFDLQRYENC